MSDLIPSIQSLPPLMKKPSHHRLLISALTALIIIVILVAFGLIIDYQKHHRSLEDSLRDMATDLKQNQVGVETPQRDGEIILSAANTVVKVGDILTVNILMNTKGANIVLGSALVKYNQNLLALLAKDNGVVVQDSVLNMSILENRKAGEVEIVRGSPGNADYLDSGNGYTGEQGLLAILKFKTLKAGATTITLASENSNLILDNGAGTAMNTKLQNLKVEIK
ncbi:MAG: cohesin domain-containing protein [Patescibacteria group bacterium]|nr:cohesin domain-containing protein [Patescibacteria group bacterium]